PIRITVGKKASEDVVEVKVRASNTNIEMRVSEVVDSVLVLLQGDSE
ncbi:MAG: His/Gly/Thr/Pro-type tRNA ligase C-terminal domain-containing protein, partial [Leuconostoc falkenbergense]